MSDTTEDPEVKVSLKILGEGHGEIYTVAIGLKPMPSIIININANEDDNVMEFEVITGDPVDPDDPTEVGEVLAMLGDCFLSEEFLTTWKAKRDGEVSET